MLQVPAVDEAVPDGSLRSASVIVDGTAAHVRAALPGHV